MTEKEFFRRLFDDAVAWRFQEGDNIIFEAGPQAVRNWFFRDGYLPRLMNLEKGIILAHDPYHIAFALGSERLRVFNDIKETDIFQYSFGPQRLRKSISIDDLPLYFGNTYSNRNGKFCINPITDRPNITCFADSCEFGGEELRQLPKSQFLSDTGLTECLDLLKVTSRIIMRDLYKEPTS